MKERQLLTVLGIAFMASGCKSKPSPSLRQLESNPRSSGSAAYLKPMNIPASEYIALNKLTYGPRPEDVAYLKRVGLQYFVDEQLNPTSIRDDDCDQRLAQANLHIEYEAGKEEGNKWPALKEDRPLNCLDKDVDELWPLVDGKKGFAWEEKVRPTEEVRAATIIRSVHSRRQLHEVLTQFWHNHFNVSISKDEKIAALLPIYDRDVIRKHCLGNFREFLEAVATSGAMLYYLDNVVSKASPANENYARELFELHTLGAENYLNHLYNRWKEVPGANSGLAAGYIDQDVYEAARSFTGWTIADGSDNGKGETFPNNGKFHYFEGWHDNYQKRVLAVEFDPNQPPMADGRRVLDIVADHPATAYRICKKLCVRLVSDNPPQALIDRAVRVWLANRRAPDQIKQVVRTIALSDELLQCHAQKVKNPLELMASFLRATNASVTPTSDLLWALQQTGYALFEYHAPTGHPDNGEHWLSTNVMANRWNIVSNLMSDWMHSAQFDLFAQHPAHIRTSRQIASYWLNRMIGAPASSEAVAGLMAAGRKLDDVPVGEGDENDLVDRLNSTVALIAMLPEFQLR
jgi:uncharacterized protein (DUF1800 family)